MSDIRMPITGGCMCGKVRYEAEAPAWVGHCHCHLCRKHTGAAFATMLWYPEVERWSMTTLREKLMKIGAKVVRHGRYVTFQLAEVAVSRDLFRKILSLIDDLRPRPAPA